MRLKQIDGYTAGEDYPAYDAVPKGLAFNCQGRQPGYYADTETRCQVWHWCLHSGHQYSFLCPNGTVFNQAVRVCDWWSNVNCEGSEQLYQNNDELYRIPERQQQLNDQQQQQQQQQQQHQALNSNTAIGGINSSNRIVDSSNYSKMTKNSFRGSMRFTTPSTNPQSSYSSSQQQQQQQQQKQHQKQHNSSRNSERKSKPSSVNHRDRDSNQTRSRNRTHNTPQSGKKNNSNSNSSRGKQRYNTNKFENDAELKDYKSKIKNKYNIDYDHSLDEEYEIIEAIE
ncbi:GD13016 [Drosophila simulans]|uniref:GD13016 n=1 Tax=Drosophila simulans TaxID=7240 RepID=B4QLI8_DROSI|nr:GD13016 [Drosophila simulans]